MSEVPDREPRRSRSLGTPRGCRCDGTGPVPVTHGREQDSVGRSARIHERGAPQDGPPPPISSALAAPPLCTHRSLPLRAPTDEPDHLVVVGFASGSSQAMPQHRLSAPGDSPADLCPHGPVSLPVPLQQDRSPRSRPHGRSRTGPILPRRSVDAPARARKRGHEALVQIPRHAAPGRAFPCGYPPSVCWATPTAPVGTERLPCEREARGRAKPAG